MSSAPVTYEAHVTEMAAAHVAPAGHLLGRRERITADRSDIADITISQIVEHAHDLAIADRVAYVLASRTNTPHLVVATDTTYLVVTTTGRIEASDASLIRQPPHAPRITSIATTDGITPVITTI